MSGTKIEDKNFLLKEWKEYDTVEKVMALTMAAPYVCLLGVFIVGIPILAIIPPPDDAKDLKVSSLPDAASKSIQQTPYRPKHLPNYNPNLPTGKFGS